VALVTRAAFLDYTAVMRRMCLVVALAAGCPGNDSPPECITFDTACQPLYVPTFENVYNNTLQNTCGSARNSCHSAAGRAGGMSFEDPATAHAALLAGRVIPNNAACSEVIVRTGSPGESYQMPPGSAIPANEVCALAQWIQAGAPGPAVAP
jgi:hypothetical protein